MDDVIARLLKEIDRLGDRYEGNEDALEALQAVQNWAMEELVD